MPRRTLGFTNGAFDVLTSAHVQLLRFARQQCDRLIVGINSDESVRELKGPGRPVNTLSDRIIVLDALRAVDQVVIFGEQTPLRIIVDLCPDVLVKGGDYAVDRIVGADFVKRRGGAVLVFPFMVGRSSTRVIEAMK